MTERQTDDVNPTTPQAGAIPDFKWVNRHVPIREVCIALELRVVQRSFELHEPLCPGDLFRSQGLASLYSPIPMATPARI